MERADPELLNEIAQTASIAHRDSVAEDARLFALLNTSFADDVIAFYDAKYTYRFWRPVSAINHDGILADPAWTDALTVNDYYASYDDA